MNQPVNTMTILAIDQGTTSTRALAVDTNGRAAITSVTRHKQYYPHPGWVEHDPLELVRNIKSALVSVEDIAAVGIDNQGESCLAWHSDTLEPVSQVIVWQDNRSGEEIERLERNGVGEEVMNRAGLPLGFIFLSQQAGMDRQQHSRSETIVEEGEAQIGYYGCIFS